jgi:hypothetical protein
VLLPHTNGEIVSLEAGNKHGKNNLVHLFGAKARFLESQWPQWSKPVKQQINGKWVEVEPSRIVGFDQAKASRAMIMECSRRGIFDPAGRLRGRGSHRLPGGGLVIHYGDELGVLAPKVNGAGLKALAWHDTGLHDRFVYPAGVPLPGRGRHSTGRRRRSRSASCCARGIGSGRGSIRCCCWARSGKVISAGRCRGGPTWITGGRGTGKSTLNGRPDEGQGIIAQLYGDALFRTGNTSAAAIRQSLKNSTVPVMIDEAEASGDNRKITEVVELARGIERRQDAPGRAGSQRARIHAAIAVLVSSINMPPLEGSDRSRLAILELRPFRLA